MGKKTFFEEKVKMNLSLRKLQIYLEALGLEVDPKTISRHIKECMPIKVREQRKVEKLAKKVKSPFQKLSKFFINPDLAIPKECEHLSTRKQFNMSTEELDEYCLQCGKLLASYPIERSERQDPRKNQILYVALKRRKRP